MIDNKPDLIDQKLQDLNNDGIDRRGSLKCMAWAGNRPGLDHERRHPMSRAFAKTADQNAGKVGDFRFVQITDSHIGFNKPANPDVTTTLQTAIDKINAMPHEPDFIIHTGDLSQLSKPSEFDTLEQESGLWSSTTWRSGRRTKRWPPAAILQFATGRDFELRRCAFIQLTNTMKFGEEAPLDQPRRQFSLG